MDFNLQKSSTVRNLPLPPSLSPLSVQPGSEARQITLVGANGAGKSRFMEEMINLCGERAYCLSALSAFFPEREESTMAGSIDALYRESVRQQSYMRTDAVSQLDKLLYMLFADEMESLSDLKERVLTGKGHVSPRSSRLDIIREHWERIFPGNRIIFGRGRLMFSTPSGDDLISPTSLSQGEKAVLYYLGATLYAMRDAVIFIDSPSLFIHPSIAGNLWNAIEELRPDCIFIYDSVDEEFVSTRTNNTSIWVKRYDSERHLWDYEIIAPGSGSEKLIIEFAGNRKPVLFIEGDALHSIDTRLYSLVFPEMTVRPVGSCNKVIETTRSFNDQESMHHLRSYGIVDRDRRTDKEVEYLRGRRILVPEVAEIENIFLLPEVIRIMARLRGRDTDGVMRRVQKNVFRMFKAQAEAQALQHVRHKVKRDVECRIDARFSCITALETHIRTLLSRLQPRRHYNALREEFAAMIRNADYTGVLRVFNHKPMLPESGIHTLLGYKTKESYINGVLDVLKSHGKEAEAMRKVIRHCLRTDINDAENQNYR